MHKPISIKLAVKDGNQIEITLYAGETNMSVTCPMKEFVELAKPFVDAHRG